MVGAVGGGYLAGQGAKDAASIGANASMQQGALQAQIAKETTQKQLALTRENRDMAIGMAAPKIATSAMASAAMMDMMGFDRSTIPLQQPKDYATTYDNSGTGATATGDPSAASYGTPGAPAGPITASSNPKDQLPPSGGRTVLRRYAEPGWHMADLREATNRGRDWVQTGS